MGATDGGDAGGYGIVAATVSHDLAREVLDRVAVQGRSLSRLHGSLGQLRTRAGALSPTIPFTLLPDALFDDRTKWEVLAKGRWRFADLIALGEGRAVVRLLQMLVRDVSAHNHVAISLQDNSITSYSHAKGRSSAVAVNFLCRRKAAMTLATNIRLILPWLESLRQPADDASRDC